ncbi:hypothetical protein GCM10028805_32420 [Spirosoma harenae]
MKQFALFLFMLLVAKLVIGQTPKQIVEDQVRMVETSLMPPLQLADEPPVRFKLEDRMRHYHVPGLSIALINEGRIEWAKSYGYLSSDSTQKADIQTIFQAASISKPITALAVLYLVQEGKLRLDEDVNTYLKTWKLKSNRFTTEKPITLRALLSHTAGLTVHGFRGYAAGETIPSTIQILNGEKPANSPPVVSDTIPGSRWSYSGGGYVLMQQLLEDVTGIPFPDFLQQTVLKPIGMNHSTYQQPLPETWEKNASIGHFGDGKKVPGNWHTYPEMAPAGLWTTPSDLARYIIEMQQSLKGKANHVLDAELTRNMLTKQLGEHGLGPEISRTGDSLVFSHGGGNVGYKCYFYSYANTGQGVVVMTNADRGLEVIFELMRSISHVYKWPDFKSIIKKTVRLSIQKLAAMAGDYTLKNRTDRLLRLTMKGNSLLVKQLWNDMEYTLCPQSDREFFVKEYGDLFTFESSVDGNITSVNHFDSKWIKIK